ncbi:MAG: oligosaccharide flippase family protein [Anaerolineae bacterium]|nr:oligosaccharide flippase family protein [Anaerolineae bacterium]
MQRSWAEIWAETNQNAAQRAMFALFALNGLSPQEIGALGPQHVNAATGWVRLDSGQGYPLVKQSAASLASVTPQNGCYFDAEAVAQFFEGHGLQAEEAQRRLAGAIWYTSEDGRVIQNLVSGQEPSSGILPLSHTFPFSILRQLDPATHPAMADQSRATLQTAADWLEVQALSPQLSWLQRVVRLLAQGQLIFLISGSVVNGLNLVHNLIMGRLLSPEQYGQLTLIITLQLLLGLLATTLQTVTARFGAGYAAHQDRGTLLALRRAMRRAALGSGAFLLLLLAVTSPGLREVFTLDHAALLWPLALALPFLFLMGADRGLLQGLNRFQWLSGAYLAEGMVRLVFSVGLGVLLVSAGLDLEGAIIGVALSVLASWAVSWYALRQPAAPEVPAAPLSDAQRAWLRLSGAVFLALLGQALITNSDFLLVKNLFSPTDSGLYAAISVLGRIAYFGALPLTVVLVPLVARRQALGEPTLRIFWMLMLGGGLICGGLVLGAAFFAELVLGLVYGPEYEAAARLLPPYTLAASLYVLTNLAITYQVALGNGQSTALPLVAGVAQVLGVLLFHASLMQVISVQLVIMSVLLVVVVGRVLLNQASTPPGNLRTVEGSA